MRENQSLVRPSCSPRLPSVRKARLSSGLSDLGISPTVFWVTSSSSALIVAKRVRFHTDRRAVQCQRGIDLQGLLHQKTLAVIIGHPGEVGAERSVAR